MEITEQDITYASSLLQMAAWRDYYLKRLKDACFQKLNELASAASPADDIKRGWIQALNWAISFPQLDIDEYSKFREEQEKVAAEESATDPRSEYGFQSPYIFSGQPTDKEH